LRLHHDPEHLLARIASLEDDHRVGAILGWLQIRELRGAKRRRVMRRRRHPSEREELRRKLRAKLDETHEPIVLLRRHAPFIGHSFDEVARGVGYSLFGRLLLVVHVEVHDETTNRIISARRLEAGEARKLGHE